LKMKLLFALLVPIVSKNTDPVPLKVIPISMNAIYHNWPKWL